MMEVQTEFLTIAVAAALYFLHIIVFSVRRPRSSKQDKLAEDELEECNSSSRGNSRRDVVQKLVLPSTILLLAFCLWMSRDEASPRVDEKAVTIGLIEGSENALLDAAASESLPFMMEQEEICYEKTQESQQMPETTAPLVPARKKIADISHSSPIPKGSLLTWNLTRQKLISHNDGDLVYYKSAYWGWLTLGSPAQQFKVVFDTGSGHLILPSMYCRSETCRMHRRYSRMKSTTVVDIDVGGDEVKPGMPRDQITVSFGTGQITGVYMEETVCMDGAETNALMPVGQHLLGKGCLKLRFVAAIDMTPEPFKTFKFDGILGLGLSDLSQNPEFNYMGVLTKTLAEQGYGHHQIFAIFLSKHEKENSELTVGGWNDEHIDGKVYWNSVYQPEHGHWLLKVKRVTFDGVPLPYCDEGCKAVVDTGSSLMAVPSSAFPEIWESLRHPADPEGTCQGPGPVMRFELDNFVVDVGPDIYAGLERSKVPSPSMPFPENSTAYCKPILMSMELPEPVGPKLFILGEPVLRKYLTVYDVKEKRIGFARARHMPEPPESDDDDDWWYE